MEFSKNISNINKVFILEDNVSNGFIYHTVFSNYDVISYNNNNNNNNNYITIK